MFKPLIKKILKNMYILLDRELYKTSIQHFAKSNALPLQKYFIA